MFDVQGLPPGYKEEVFQFFTSPDANSWQEWVQPRGISMIAITMCGGGGGGGAGLSGANPSARGGGCGGGSAAMTTLFLPAVFVPNVLWVQVGKGGAGGASSGNAGSSGSASFVSSMPPNNTGTAATLTTAIYMYLKSEGTAAAGGSAGSATVGTGGNAGTAISTANALWTAMGSFVSVAGKPGALGGSGAGNNVGADSQVVAVQSSPFCRGAGGGSANSTDNNGGSMPGSSYTSAVTGGTSAVPIGSPGQTLWVPLVSTGGCGGAGITAGTGGKGGDGGVGSGGGGGGAGVTGGAGGKGGDGYVTIICW